MHFEQSHLYHVFNQGNNRQKVFYVDAGIEKEITDYEYSSAADYAGLRNGHLVN